MHVFVRSYCATVGKIDGPTVRCDDGVDGEGAIVPRDNTASTKTICSIGSCASYVLDDDDLGWTVVSRGSNKSKTKTWHKDLCQEACKSWKAFIGICANGSGVRLTQWDYFQSWSWSCSNLDLRKVVLCLFCLYWMRCVVNLGSFWSPGTRLE